MYHTASEEEAKQVMSASRFQSAEINDCTSHKTFALPKLIYKDGDNLLSRSGRQRFDNDNYRDSDKLQGL